MAISHVAEYSSILWASTSILTNTLSTQHMRRSTGGPRLCLLARLPPCRYLSPLYPSTARPKAPYSLS